VSRHALRGLLALWLWCSGPVFAQSPAPDWNAVPGAAADISIDAEGAVYAAGRDEALWLWRDDAGNWAPIPGRGLRIAALPDKRLWVVRKDGGVMHYDGRRWLDMGAKALDVAVSADGTAYIARSDGRLARWNGKIWTDIPGKGTRLAVHPDGSVWTVLDDGVIVRNEGSQAQTMPGRARDLAISTDGEIWMASSEGDMRRWTGADWDEPDRRMTDAAVIALSPGGIPWAATTSGAIRTQAKINSGLLGDFSSAQAPDGVTFRTRGRATRSGSPRDLARARAAASVVLKPPAQVTDTAPFEFVDTRTIASRIAIGQDGSVFAIAPGGGLGRWSNARNRFLDFPGQLVRLSVDPGGLPWGINQAGRIFRHTGTDWKQVTGTASDISVGVGRDVFATSADGVLSRFDPATNRFSRVPGQAYFVATAPDGTPWGLLLDGTVVRCAALPCERLGRDAQSLSIGPDGSVFIVTFGNQLRRFVPARREFELIPVPGHEPVSVAVGPAGRPWVITTEGKVLSSRFFPRDESLDPAIVASSITPTTGTGDIAELINNPLASGSDFTFSKKITFTAVNVPCAVLDDIAVGVDGSVIALCDFKTLLVRYSSKTKNFSAITGLPLSAGATIQSVDIDTSGNLWLLSGDVDGRLIQQTGKTSFKTLQLPVTSPVTNPAPGSPVMNRDIAIGPDGTVYAIDTSGFIYRKLPTQSGFSKFIAGTYSKVAVGAASDVWLLNTSAELFQLVGGKLERRPLKGNLTFEDIGGGADGSIYATRINPATFLYELLKWNANNSSFDIVNVQADHVDVAPNGRPWITNTSMSPDVFMAK